MTINSRAWRCIISVPAILFTRLRAHYEHAHGCNFGHGLHLDGRTAAPKHTAPPIAPRQTVARRVCRDLERTSIEQRTLFILPRMPGTAQAGTLTRCRWILNPLGLGPRGLGETANLRTPTAFLLYLTLQGWVLTTR